MIRKKIFWHIAVFLSSAALTVIHAKAGYGEIKDLKAISAADDYTVGLKRDGRVLTWGGNINGHLGDGSSVNYRVLPGAVVDLENIIAINSCYEHTAVVRLDGTAWAWGRNAAGQLGTGALGGPYDGYSYNRPVQVKDPADPSGYMNDVAAVRVFNGRTFFIKENRTLWGVGTNANAELGAGFFGGNCGYSQCSPVQANITGVIDIASRGSQTFALKEDGTVWAWGNNWSGVLGVGSGAHTGNHTTPQQVVNSDETGFLTGIINIEAGANIAMALRDDGTVWTWGYNTYYALGHGPLSTSYISPTPQMVMDGSGNPLTDIISIAAGNRSVAALRTNGTVLTWGFYVSGDGTTANRYRAIPVLTDENDPTSYLTDVIAIAGGGGHTVALKNDGSAWAWGDNDSGQIGDGTRHYSNQKVVAVPVLMPTILFDLDMPDQLPPGARTEIKLFYQNIFNDPLADTLVAVDLPGEFRVISGSEGMIERDDTDSFRVFWNVGDVLSLELGNMSMTVEVPFGLPEGIKNVAGTLAARNFADNVIDIDDYLAYNPVKVVAEYNLTETEISELLATDAELSDLMDYAGILGYTFYNNTKFTELSDGSTVYTFILFDLLEGGPVFLQRTGDAAYLEKYSDDGYSQFDRDGGYHVNTEDGSSSAWGTWAEPHSMALAWCLWNCLTEAVSFEYIKQLVSLVNMAANASDCYKCLAYKDPASCTKCGQHILDTGKSLVKGSPLIGLAFSSGECIAKCLQDPNSHYCLSGQEKKQCGESWVVQYFFGQSGEGVWVTKCDGSSGRWMKPYFDWCIAGETCVKGACRKVGQISTTQNIQTGTKVEIYRPQPVIFRPGHDPNAKYVDYRGSVIPGQVLTYTLEYENTGLGTAYHVFILDQLSPHLDDGTLQINDGGIYDSSLRLLEWQIGEVGPGAGGTVSFSVGVKDPLPNDTEIANSADVHFPTASEITPTNPVVNVVKTIAADQQTAETTAGQPVSITLTGRDYYSRPLTYTVTAEPGYGALIGTPPDLVYTPEGNFTGQDELHFHVSAESDTSEPARVVIIVGPDPSDTTPPEVVETTPLHGDTSVYAPATPITTEPSFYAPTIKATFSEELDPATINESSFTIDGLAGIVRYRRLVKEARFTPLDPLTPSTTFTAHLGAEITDLAGNPLAAEYSWQFTTQSPVNIGVNLPDNGAEIDFGATLVPANSPEKVVTVLSTGLEDLQIGTIEITGPEYDSFSIVDGFDTCSDTVLPPAGTCTLRVAFSPQTVGLKIAVLEIPSNDPDSPLVSVVMRGTGITEGTEEYTLTTIVDPSGSGTVSSGDGGISCSPDCTETYFEGVDVTLTAAPSSGFEFISWSGCDVPSGNVCTVTMNGDKTVTASFSPLPEDEHTLSVTLDPSEGGTVTGDGIDCPGTCSGIFDENSTVTLTAAPSEGYEFGSFAGCDSASEAGCTVAMTVDRTVTATFNPIEPPNSDPVVNAGPDFSIPEGSIANISASFTDSDTDDTHTASIDWGDSTSVPGSVSEGGGSGTVSGSHSYGLEGVYTVTVTVTDNEGGAGSDTMEVTVYNLSPTADSQSVTTDEDTPVPITLSGSDPGGDPLTYSIDTNPSNGFISGSPPALTYSPNPDFNGADSFTFVAYDGVADSSPATVSITVNPVNDPPDAQDDAASTDEDTTLNVAAPGVLNNDSDVDGDSLTAGVLSGPSHGILTLSGDGSYTYAPDADYHGTDGFSYMTSDGNGGTDTASVTVTVSPVNDPPLATADYTSGTVQYSDGIPPVSITGSDIDSIALTISSTWTKDGGPGQGGLPEGLSLSEAVCDGSMPLTCTWTLGGEALVPAGIYGITFNTVDDGPSGGLTDSVTINLTVGEEDAAAVFDPDNPVAIEVEVPGGESGPFSLVLYVNETLPDVAAYGPYPGEIDRANCQMELVPVGPGSSIPGACSAGSVSGSGYDAILPVTCSFDGVPVNTYTVEGTVYGVYYSGGAEDVFTIYDSSLGFTTGGGWFYWPGTDEKTNFGFTMKYNRKATNLKGNLLLIRHLPNGTIYRLKSNALQGLSLGESADEDGSFGWASFSGKATYLEPGWTEPEGNHEFVTYVEDRSEPGSAIDRFWIEVKDKDGNNVLNLSIGRPAEENAEMLHGGTIVVPHSGGGN